MPHLTIERGPRAGAEHPLDGPVVLGRTPGPATQLWLDHASVSRRHASIMRVDDEFVLVDLGSANGTFVNGRRIAGPTRLRDGDTIAVGAVSIRFACPAPAPPAPAAGVEVHEDDRPDHQRHVVLRVPASEDAPTIVEPSQAAAMAAAMGRRLEFLNRLGTILGQGFDRAAIVAFVLDSLLELLPQADRAFILLEDPASGRMMPHAARTRGGATGALGVSRTLVDEAVRRREAIVVLDTQTDGAYAEAESIRMLGLRSVMCAPLIYDNAVCGVLQVDSTRAGSPFGRPDAVLLVGIAGQVALVLAIARLHESELERELLDHDLALARRIQRQFFPAALPVLPGYRVAAVYEPALAVGGDFYDAFLLGDGRLAILAGDVAGKGVSAALLVARLSSDIRYHAAAVTAPDEILRRANASLESSASEGMFATVCLLVLDPASGRLAVANAGHPAPLRCDAAGRVTPLASPACAPLGLAEPGAIEAAGHELPPGASVTLFTDGITEAVNTGQELFGVERLTAVLAPHPAGADRLKDAVVEAVRRFRGAAPQSDDLTLVVVGRDP
jgi:phosphoserine phosphatase RsbU/P